MLGVGPGVGPGPGLGFGLGFGLGLGQGLGLGLAFLREADVARRDVGALTLTLTLP